MWVPPNQLYRLTMEQRGFCWRVFRDLYCIIAGAHVCTTDDCALQGLHDDSSTAAEMQDTFDSSAVMEQEGKRDSLGCMSMFQGPPKRLIRPIKLFVGPGVNVGWLVGSSFNVRWLLLPGRASQRIPPATSSTRCCESCMACMVGHVQ